MKGERSLPLVSHRHDPSLEHRNLLVCGHGHVEVLERQVAPPAIVVWETRIGGTEIGCCHRYGLARQAPFTTRTRYLVAGAARQPLIEEGQAQGHRVGPVPRSVQVPVPTSTSCCKPR